MSLDNDKINQMFTRPARKKWRRMQEQGYFGFHVRTGGVVFGTRDGGEAGHISWFGRVTWLKNGE